MDKPAITLAILLTASAAQLLAQPSPDGEVRLPLSELRRLLAEQAPTPVAEKPPEPAPALLSARLVVSRTGPQPEIAARFRVMSFGGLRAITPLFQGELSLLEVSPPEAIVIRQNNHTCLVTSAAGPHEVTLRLIPTSLDNHRVRIPECVSMVLECGKLPDNEAVEITTSTGKRLLRPGEQTALPMDQPDIHWQIIRTDTPAAPAPTPSTWTWRHEVLVLPQDDFLEHRSSSRASARDGSGAEAKIDLPRGAYEVVAEGPDLVKSTTNANETGTPVLHLTWKTQGILERRVEIRYRLAASPLDPEWTLRAPTGGDIRYLLAAHPQFHYQADALTPAVAPIGLPAAWTDALAGNPIHAFPADGPATIRIAAKPVAETATGVIPEAKWEVQIEPDGALIAHGFLVVSHKSPYDFIWQVPPGMELLSCELNQTPTPPTRPGDNRMSLHLPGANEAATVKLTFTGRIEALHPLEGTLDLALPDTPSFIARLDWHIRLPDGYQAETSGNLTRIPVPSGTSTIHLRKNLSRNEQPQTRLFYQHTRTTR